MDIFVISLTSSTDRRTDVSQQLMNAGLEFIFLDAVDGRIGKHPLLSRFRPTEFMARHGRPGLPGEAGCYASHFLVWKKCVELNQPIIVIEDDFILSESAKSIFELALDLSARFGFVRLEPSPNNIQFTVWSNDTVKLKRFIKVPQCTTCYAISPEAAQKFISSSEKFVLPVDYFIRHTHLHHVPIYGLTPTPVFQRNDSTVTSIIGNRHKDKGPLWCKLTKLLFKISNLGLNSFENIKFYIKDLSRSQ